jgi:Ca2+-binding RTX toxin-like protein
MAAPSYSSFLNALGERESGGNYAAVNQFGYLGKYQFGELALRDLGYYTADGTSKNDWKPGFWTGKSGIDSKQEFLASHSVQETAIRDYMKLQWQYVKGAWAYEGQTLDGVKITVSGMLAGAHLVGAGNLKNYLLSGGDNAPADGNGVGVESYVKQFAGYMTPYAVDHAVAETLSGGAGKDTLNGRGGDDVLSGRGGNDKLYGAGGKGLLTGGSGADTFDFNAFGQSARGSNRDQIKDFSRAQGDKIDLVTIDADTSSNSGNDVFKFIGTATFKGGGGELRCAGGIVQGDVDGDKVADFEIKVNLATLLKTDFLL